MTRHMIALAALFAAPSALMAQDMPPQGSMPLSQVVTKLETDVGTDLAFISEVSWDDDGYWEVDYVTTDRAKVEVKIDPATGEVRR